MLCVAKQNGEYDAWPQDVVLGASKTIVIDNGVTLTYWPHSIAASLVRINDGTLDFMITKETSLQSSNYTLVIQRIYNEAQTLVPLGMVELNRTRDKGNYTINGHYAYLPYLNEYKNITDRPNNLIETDAIASENNSITIGNLQSSNKALFTASQPPTSGFPVITMPLRAQVIDGYYLFRDYGIFLPAVFRIGNPAAV